MTPSGDDRAPYGAKPPDDMLTAEVLVIAVFTISRPPVVVKDAPRMLPVDVTDPAATDPEDVMPAAVIPVAVRLVT
jgi:hypothetical protein